MATSSKLDVFSRLNVSKLRMTTLGSAIYPVIVLGTILTACGQDYSQKENQYASGVASSEQKNIQSQMANMPAMAAASADSALEMMPPPSQSAPVPPPEAPPPAPPPNAPIESPNVPPIGRIAQIAYSYIMDLEMPAQHVIATQSAHVKACRDAGPQQCQILESTSNQQGKDIIQAHIRLQAVPQWLDQFRASVIKDVAGVSGTVKQNTISSEDLTRQIVDSDAQLRAKTSLRTRLEDLLAHRTGKLSELLEVERELARVQGEIDSIQSQLAVMRSRIAMSDLTITYSSEGVPLNDQTADPTRAAFNDFLGLVSLSVANILRLIATFFPWILLILAGIWLVKRRSWRRKP